MSKRTLSVLVIAVVLVVGVALPAAAGTGVADDARDWIGQCLGWGAGPDGQGCAGPGAAGAGCGGPVDGTAAEDAAVGCGGPAGPGAGCGGPAGPGAGCGGPGGAVDSSI